MKILELQKTEGEKKKRNISSQKCGSSELKILNNTYKAYCRGGYGGREGGGLKSILFIIYAFMLCGNDGEEINVRQKSVAH